VTRPWAETESSIPDFTFAIECKKAMKCGTLLSRAASSKPPQAERQFELGPLGGLRGMYAAFDCSDFGHVSAHDDVEA
jgi:hypothetical protein